MKDIKKIWTALVQSKQATARNHIEYALLRAVTAKKVDPVTLAKLLLAKSFTPITKQIKLDNGRTPMSGLYRNKPIGPRGIFGALYDKNIPILGTTVAELFIGCEDEYNAYVKLIEAVFPLDGKQPTFNHEYVYIFTRQDMTPEQQLVQSAHATLVLGSKLAGRDVSELYFAVIGVPDLAGLSSVIKDLGDIEYVTFYEPDIGNTMTSIATMPIPYRKRGKLLKYSKLSFTPTVQ